MGTVNIPVTVLGTKFQKDVKFYVSDSKANIVILGRDFMQKFETVTFNFNKNWVKSDNYVVHDHNSRRKERVELQEGTTIRARTERGVAVKCRKVVSMIGSMFNSKGIWGHPGMYGANAIVIPNSSGVFYVPLPNVTDKDIIIRKRKPIGILLPPTEYDRHNDAINIAINKVDSETCFRAEDLNINPTLPTAQYQSVTAYCTISIRHCLLHKERNCVGSSKSISKESTNKISHKIITNESQP